MKKHDSCGAYGWHARALCDDAWRSARLPCQYVILPCDGSSPEFFQPSTCAYTDDLAVAACSFRDLLPHIEVACTRIDEVTGMSLNHHKCGWVQYGLDWGCCVRPGLSCHEDGQTLSHVGTAMGSLMAGYTCGVHQGTNSIACVLMSSALHRASYRGWWPSVTSTLFP